MSKPEPQDAASATETAAGHVLPGLTSDETSEYFSLSHAEPGLSCQEAQERFRALRRKHFEAIKATTGSSTPDGGGRHE